MFASRYFNPRYWAERYWPKIGDTVVVVVPNAPGLEYSIPGNRCHYEAQENNVDYSFDTSKMHYEVKECD